ncbi:MAG TPA: hypothetical protein VM910_29680 [Bradyrhizobium sp.]|nr:hypothetical protein [Bradyrhizobium sp.]
MPGQAIAATAPTNKSLAQRSKSLDTGKATKTLPRRTDPARPIAVQVRSFDVRGSLGRDCGINRPMERNPMSLHFRRSAGLGRNAHVQQAAVVAQPTAIEERFWQAVALEIAEGLCKAVLLIGSIVAGIVLGVVVAAMSSQL